MQMINLRLRLASGAAIAALLAATSPAFAQTAAVAAAAAPAAADSSAGQVQEVVVTANKRRENLQQVPVAVTAVTAQAAAAAGVSDISSLQTVVPGLEFPRIFSGTTPTLRGVGTTFGFGGQENVVALYLDDVYIASPAATTFNFNNIDQIEVLKGPQGTLFGRNAMAGVVNIATRTPNMTPHAEISAGFANYETFSGSFYGSTPITDKLAADLAILGDNQAQGWGKNLFTGKDVFTNRDLAVRSKWVYRPDDLTTVTLTGDYANARYDEGIAMHPVQGSLFLNGQGYQGYYNVNENAKSLVNTQQGGASLKIDRDLGWADLISITAGRSSRTRDTADVDQSVANNEYTPIHDDLDSESEELRLASKPGGNFHWLAGFFYFHDLSELTFSFTGNLLGPLRQNIDFKQTVDSYAGFGQATYDLPAGFHLTGGLRYTYDQIGKNGLTAVIAPTGTSTTVGTGQANDSAWTYKVNLAKDLTSTISAYVGYSTGFKGGVYNALSVTDPAVKPEHLDDIEGGFKSELFDRRLRFNLAAFHYTYTNLQVTALVQSPTGATLPQLANAATATNTGVEVDFEAHPTNAFTFRGGFEAMHSRFTSFPDATISVPIPGGGNNDVSGSAKGLATPHSPDFTGYLGADYHWDTSAGEFMASLAYSYTGAFAWDVDNRLQQHPYNLLNGSVRWTSRDRAWDVNLWAKNITGAEYSAYTTANSIGDEESPAPPRTFGVTFTRHFE